MSVEDLTRSDVLGRCPGRRHRHRRVRLRGRRQPDAPRRAGHRAGRVGQRGAAREGRPARDARCDGPHRRRRDRRPARRRRRRGHLARACRRPRPCSWRPARRGVPVWGEVELAWRLRDPDHPGAWLCVTGTNGKTTTVQMLDAILKAAGLSSVACGNVGLPIVEAVMDPEPYAVYAVELSSFQLHYTSSMSAHAAAVLNVAEDHLDWYTGPDGMADYAADKGRIYHQVQLACDLQRGRPGHRAAGPRRRRGRGRRAVGFTLGTPAVGMVGLVEDVLADRAFIDDAGVQRRRAVHAGRPGLDRRRTSSPTPWPPPRWPGRRRAPGRRARRAASLRPRRPPDRRGGHRRGGPLRRRLQGHQPARRHVVAAGVRRCGVGRGRAGQGRDVRRPGRARARPAARSSCCWAGTAR